MSSDTPRCADLESFQVLSTLRTHKEPYILQFGRNTMKETQVLARTFIKDQF